MPISRKFNPRMSLGLVVALLAGCQSGSIFSFHRSQPGSTETALRPAGDGPGSSMATAAGGAIQETSAHTNPSDAPAAELTAALGLPTLKLATDGPLVGMLKPSNDRVWSPDQAVMPSVEIHGDEVSVHNIRNSQYRTVDDYTVRYYDKIFELSKLKTVDFIVVPFADTPAIAHVMLSFGFDDKDYLVSSVEIRKERGEKYNALAGFFNQYELMYVLADERDVMWKNSIGWLCEVFVYRTRATPVQARELFVDVCRRVNQLRDKPEFYNTLTNNCTTNIRQHINRLAPDRVPYDYRVLLPGYSDRLAYDLNLLDTNTSFEQTRQRAKVNYQAYLYRDDPDFSQKIRR